MGPNLDPKCQASFEESQFRAKAAMNALCGEGASVSASVMGYIHVGLTMLKGLEDMAIRDGIDRQQIEEIAKTWITALQEWVSGTVKVTSGGKW